MEIGSYDSRIPPVAVAGPAVPAALRAEQDQLIKAVQAVNEAQVFGENTELVFVLDRHTRKPVLRLVDRRTQEVIRQVPPETALRLAGSLSSDG
jgi:uncharacterized FlaG/YvyC family protein